MSENQAIGTGESGHLQEMVAYGNSISKKSPKLYQSTNKNTYIKLLNLFI